MLIYLHIPFCDSKCFYCAFNSYVDKSRLKKSYMQAILEQLDYELSLFKPKLGGIKSLFIGGGTPSTIEPQLYREFFHKIEPYLKNGAEVTTEANPNSATKSWLKGMKSLGVNRISFGVQTFDDEKLKFLGRNHNRDIAIKAINNAKKIGFQNISLDLIYGTNKDTKSLLLNDLKIAKSLPVNHISAYSLTIEENTPFFKTPDAARDSVDLSRFFINQIEKNEFPQYEISNFGIYQSIHNLGYWSQDDYIGIGSGAVGFLKNKRFYISKNIENFIQNPFSREVENLSKDALHVEAIFMGLRSRIGVDLNIFSPKELKRIDRLIEADKLKMKNGTIYNTDYLLSDELTLYIVD